MTYRELIGPQENSGLLDVVTLGIIFQAIGAIVLIAIAWHIPAETNIGLLGIVATLACLIYVIYSIAKSVDIADTLRAADAIHDEHRWLALYKPESDTVIAQADDWILRYRKSVFSHLHVQKMKRIIKLRDNAASFDIENFDDNASVAYLELKAEMEKE